MLRTSVIDYQDGALACRGYLAHDDALQTRRPGVLVVHEAWGLDDHAKERARMLAGMGYVALAADMFGRGRLVDSVDEGRAVIADLLSNPQKLLARAGAALEVLRTHSGVDAGRIGAIGFCFGGSTALQLARSGADLRGIVSFHGRLSTAAPAGDGAIKSSVLVCVGADDPMIPTDQVEAFKREMRAAGADWQVVTYGGAVHSFTNHLADGSVSPAILYNEKADRRSWAAMKSFFDEVFD
jgi:dienelactone hydrolase